MSKAAVAAKKGSGINRKKRAKSFMVKPDDGWLHDDRALNAGRGIYVTYPTKFIGTIEVKSSIRQLSIDDQTSLARAAIKCVNNPDASRDIELTGSVFSFGIENTGLLPCNISISVNGILLAPEGYKGGEDDPVGIIDFKEMRLVSLAAGGEDEYYDYIVYIAKDKKTGKREAFVFDCGEVTDQVLATLGQAFNLAVKEAEAKRRAKEMQKMKPPQSSPPPRKTSVTSIPEEVSSHTVDYDTGNYTKSEEAFALPASVEAVYDAAATAPVQDQPESQYDTADPAKVEALYDVANPKVAAIVTDSKGKVDDVADELLKLMQSEACAIYETTEQFMKNARSPKLLVQKLNEREEAPELRQAARRDKARPTWEYFKPSTMPKKADLKKLRAQAKLENA